MAVARLLGIFVVEGDWHPDLRTPGTMRPLLQLLEEQANVQAVHRDVGTTTELKYYASKWSSTKYKDFRMVYLAFHGKPGKLLVGDEQVTLEELAELLGSACRGRVVHFGSCATVRVSRDRLADFKRKTGAVAVSGYEKTVGWLESAAFEAVLIGALSHYSSPRAVINYMDRTVPDLCQHLGWHWS